MSPRSLPYPVFDIDNHMYETKEALTKFLPKEHKGKVGYVEVNGRPKLVVKDHISHMIPNPTFERVARPGSAEDYFLGNNPEGLNFREFVGEAMDVIPAYQYPAPRVELMDELGIDRCVMYPTLASLIEERTTDDVILTHAVMHALNEWMHEHWTFDYEGRIFATPVITLPLVDKAIEELHWCLERNMKTFLVRPAPVPSRFGGSRSMGLPEFDPFWQEVVNAGIPVTMHASDSGYQKHLMEWEGGDEYLSFKPSALREVVMGHRAIEDTLAAMICHGALSRFPDLKILCVENGSGWVKNLLGQLNTAYRIMPKEFDEHPVEVFKRNIYIHPFLEDDIQGIIDVMGVDHVLFGSDFPHPEGIGDPLSFVDRLEGVSEEDKAKIMGGNAMGLLGIHVPA
ncbi:MULTISPECIES: amidohydrolase family protein [Mycobacterium]|uniref:Amidohydrolase n=1 Tax=Mycobacterium kyorinense TaxID=487514 RepID=A0A1X1XQU7_9MYCO|nr:MULTISPECIES: amidohydrolase family protein [Mycobacterium]ORW01222.1 amidohydrolase [Mycobacterium kyorinense]GBE64486.1 amidohydrolase [Mycobacterium sp. MFM001]